MCLCRSNQNKSKWFNGTHTVAHRGKTQLNFCSETQQSFREHNNLFENTTKFPGTQQSFSEHNEIS